MGLHHDDFHTQRRELHATQANPLTLYTPKQSKKPKRIIKKASKTMRVKATLINFKSKLSKSCNRFVSLFRFRVKRPVFVRPLRARHGNVKPRHQHHHPKKPICSCLCFLSTSKNHRMSNTKPRSSSCKTIFSTKSVQHWILSASWSLCSLIVPLQLVWTMMIIPSLCTHLSRQQQPRSCSLHPSRRLTLHGPGNRWTQEMHSKTMRWKMLVEALKTIWFIWLLKKGK